MNSAHLRRLPLFPGPSFLEGKSSYRSSQSEVRDVYAYMKKVVHRLYLSEDGPTTVEYAVLIALIIGVCLATAQTMATATRESFDTSADAIDGAFSP